MTYETQQPVLQKVADSYTDKPLDFSYSIEPKNWMHKALQALRLKPKSKSYQVRNLTCGNMIRISGKVSAVSPDSLKVNSFESQVQVIKQNMPLMLYICAVGLLNSRDEPSEAFIKELRENLTGEEVKDLTIIILDKLNIEVFISTIAWICGHNMMAQK